MRDKLEPPDPLTVSDWLLNLLDIIEERGRKVLEESPSSVDMPVLFTLMNSLLSTNNTLHLAPKGVPALGDIFLEYRLYYDCFFQFQLSRNFVSPEDHIRISKLYAIVTLQTENALRQIFASNPRIGSLLQRAIDGYGEFHAEATNLYIRGRHPKAVRRLIKSHGIREPSLANALILAGRLVSACDFEINPPFPFESC